MALHESALEELGLAPMWVRRGIAAAVSGEAASAVAAADEVEVAAEPVEMAAPDSSPAVRAGAEPVPASGAKRPADQPDFAAAAPQAKRELAAKEPFVDAPQAAAFGGDEPPPLTEDDFPWLDAELVPAFEPAGRAESGGLPPVHGLDWDALAARVASCERCRLCEKRTNTVFGVGDQNADWMLIGEAPGENEDKQGEPFVGQAGKLLDNMLRSLALARGTNVYIANVIKCRPPGNRNPEPDEVARCEPYLQRQVALVKPKLIIALGRFAAQSLLKTDASISSLRGRVHQYEGVPVIVTYHPAYLLRSLPDKSKAWADLCLARDTYRRAGGQAADDAQAQK
ncbi:uracil-DNA glycosylase [Trinickia terrae]|uniref:Type-4 uracil-DNA glycosylase n=1 Tax=Trinickia terrae TaxID=2571161 RepID=A0A4U1HR74_9BURK|nr:uracil-DNA glycosylase [Trinickia terrae]TKC82668.1 uracil-DNA glycosylase [Trinickia terrae]